ncbi:MAG: hypothetical protein J6T55_01325 [Alphaproteobacteria bacterium]|nr:hypothetical protein [Alphaproteobacteria bacterium]
MKILKILYDHFMRLNISLGHQIPWFGAGIIFYFYAHQTFPKKIQLAFGISEAQERLTQATQSTAFMKNMVSFSNPMASVNYLSSLIDRTMAWSRLTSSQMFANATTSFSLWIIDILLYIGVFYLIWRTYKTYRQKGHQKQNAKLILKEMSPCFNQLHQEIQELQTEIKSLKEKNAKSNSANSSDPRG